MLEFIGGMAIGVIAFISYGTYRAIRSDGWDDSNVFNWIRLLGHAALHPEDFAKMYYLSDEALQVLFKARELETIEFHKPFPYISKDEFAENFPSSRP